MLLNIFAEVVGPSSCAACDVPVGPRIVFCPGCAGTVVGAYEYGGALATAISRLKYHDRPDLARRLAGLVLSAHPRLVADVVVPVPLHPRRLAERGFNQAALIAWPIARQLGVPLAARALSRVRDTPKQAGLDRQTRLVNLRNAFVAHPERIKMQNPRILLVDDVQTTGATFEACIAALHEVGLSRVSTVVVARRT